MGARPCKAKDLTFEAKDKDLGFKAKAKDSSIKAKDSRQCTSVCPSASPQSRLGPCDASGSRVSSANSSCAHSLFAGCQSDQSGASTPYKRWSKCTMKKIGGRFLQELRGEGSA